MRWTKPTNGQTRVRSKFLFWPKRIMNETRWLEFATWREKFVCYSGYDGEMRYWKVDGDWHDKETDGGDSDSPPIYTQE